METSVLRGTPEIQIFPQVQDDISQTYGNLDGLSFCGTRSFEINTDSAIWTPWATFVTDTFSVETTDSSHVNVYSVTVRTFLTELT